MPPTNFLDLTGQKFFKMTVLGRDMTKAPGVVWWLCQCDCGNFNSVRSQPLRRGQTKSCGCLKDISQEKFKTYNLRHGKRHTKEYRAWVDMRRRCDTPSQTSYGRYGGRGIRVCEAWDASFETFFADIGPAPSPSHSLDRIDPNGNYEPSNCRWATQAEQSFNTRRTRRVEFRGELVLLKPLAERHGISAETVDHRLKKGWPIERALMEKPRGRNV